MNPSCARWRDPLQKKILVCRCHGCCQLRGQREGQVSSTWFTLVELCCGSSWYPELEDLDRLSLTLRGPPLPPPQSHFTARKAELKRERGQFLVPLRVQSYLHRGGRPRWVEATTLSTSFKHIQEDLGHPRSDYPPLLLCESWGQIFQKGKPKYS